MCKFCGSLNYRKIYENHYGQIPVDDLGRKYDIHHIDGNHDNNDPINLKAVTIQEHYDIHLSNNDYKACHAISLRLKLSHDVISKLARNAQLERVKDGTHHFLNGNIARDAANKRVQDGTHNLLKINGGSEQSRSNALKRIEEGTFHMLKQNGGSEKARKNVSKQIENGTHNFLGSRNPVHKRVKDGLHHFQKQYKCPNCKFVGKGPQMKRYHFDNCKNTPHT